MAVVFGNFYHALMDRSFVMCYFEQSDSNLWVSTAGISEPLF